MDYRPIALLNTAYKVLGRILAERLHAILPRIISNSQQGFVRGRNIDKTDIILRALLSTSFGDPTTPWEDSPGVLCLDLRKAYDTLSREFLQLVLRSYGFPSKILDVILALHEGTTAQFLVNGNLSQPWSVNCGSPATLHTCIRGVGTRRQPTPCTSWCANPRGTPSAGIGSRRSSMTARCS